MSTESGAGENREAASWAAASAGAAQMLAGVSPLRLPGASAGVEIAGLDWGSAGTLRGDRGDDGDGEGENDEDRPVIVMHHANGFCAATLAPVAHVLRDRYRVFSLDGRGHGSSTSVPAEDPARIAAGEVDPYAWNTLADDLIAAVAEILRRVGHESIALGLGHSFGGNLMLRAAGRAPALFDRLLLCDPVILPPAIVVPPGEAGTTSGEGASAGGSLASATRRRRKDFPSPEDAFVHFYPRSLFANFTPEALALYVNEGMKKMASGEWTLRCDRDVEAAIFDGGATSGAIERLGEIRADVTLLHALRGNFSRALYDEVAEQIPRCCVESLDVGHLFPMETPGTVLDWIRQSLSASVA